MRKKIDVNKLKYIDELPEKKFTTGTPWDAIFSSIPKGKILVFQPEEMKAHTVRIALSRYQKKGKFKNLKFTARKKGDSYASYIINSSDDTRT